MKFNSALTAASLACATSAHTIFVSLTAGGTSYDVGHAVRVPTYDGPQTDVSTQAIACNGPPNPTAPSDKIIDVQAGETVTAVWRHTLDSGPGDVMDASHKGPTIAYLKKVSDPLTDPGTGDGWFKISEVGYDAGSNTWGTEIVINNGGNQDIQIPTCIGDGYYLLRAEMIALHGARSPGGAQLYMECAQIKISGGSGGMSPATGAFPGMYSANDPGITVDIYQNVGKAYTIPGPAMFTC